MAKTIWLFCSKCKSYATPRKWNLKTPDISAEVGTSDTMSCKDCSCPDNSKATMCRDCCPTGHGTRWIEECVTEPSK